MCKLVPSLIYTILTHLVDNIVLLLVFSPIFFWGVELAVCLKKLQINCLD